MKGGDLNMATAAAEARIPLFTRASSGLVRELSITDAAWYGVFASGGLFPFVFLYPLPQFVSPGISVPLMLIFTLLYGVAIYFVYAGVGSALPRAGGDYLYESRTLHPLVGFSVPWACQILFWLAFPTAGAFVVSSFGLVPIADAVGADGLVTWLVSKNGTFVVAACVVVACWLLTVFGLRIYRPVQRWILVPGIMIAVLTILGLLLANLGTDFASKFNAYHDGQITTRSVQAGASAAGFERTGFSLRDTLIWVAVLAAYVPYTMYSAQGLLGEVKQARNLRRLFVAFLLPGVLVAIVMLALPFFLLEQIAGHTFLDQYAWAYNAGEIAPNYSPNVGVFFSMLSDNPFVTTLVAIGFVAGGFGIANVVFVNSARIMMAMGLDGSLPRLFADVSPRYHSPVKATTIWSTCALIIAAIFSYRPEWQLTILIGGAITSVIVVGVTCLGAALFPYRSPGIFAESPAAHYRIGGVPLVAVAGAFGTVATGLLIWVALSFEELGITSRDSRLAIGGAFAAGVLIYAGMRLYRRAEGVDTSLAFRTVPPE
jgi:basic amino acid/polyamine antiporter, APA family